MMDFDEKQGLINSIEALYASITEKDAEIKRLRKALGAIKLCSSVAHANWIAEDVLMVRAEMEKDDMERLLAVYREKLGEKNAEIKRLRDALETIAKYGTNGICPYGCDTPHVAKEALKGGT